MGQLPVAEVLKTPPVVLRMPPSPSPVPRNGRYLGDCRKMAYQDAQDSGSYSRRASRRIARLCNCWRNAEDGSEDKQAGMSFDRNRLSAAQRNGVTPARTRALASYVEVATDAKFLRLA